MNPSYRARMALIAVTSALAASHGASFAAAHPRAKAPPQDPYHELYTEKSSYQSFNVEIVRGMTWSDEGNWLYAINSYASSVVAFDRQNEILDASGEVLPNKVWPTVTDPVAISFYGGHIYVLGQGTHALAKQDAADGRIVQVFAPGATNYLKGAFSEPADLVIDSSSGQAFVSCMGSDSVFQIDLSGSMTEVRRWRTGLGAFPGEHITHGGADEYSLGVKRPRFLSLHGGNLYVAPFLSGNNTLTFMEGDSPSGSGHKGTDIINGHASQDSFGGALAITGLRNDGMPDADLICIDLDQPASTQISTVIRRAGSMLTAHGFHPTSDEVWMLGMYSKNLDENTEPDFKGDFARNTLVVRPLASGAPPVTIDPSSGTIDLDQPGYSESKSLPLPYALEFGGPNGLTAIASSTLSRISLRDSSGVHEKFIPPTNSSVVPDWEVVRDLDFVDGNGSDPDRLFIYCQQTSEIVVWDVPNGVPANAESQRFSLLGDPTAEDISAGRSIFYDARFSENHRSTCATCHPGGESDMLGWNIKDGLFDFKDPMVTQPLKGLRETYPFHWRGERDMEAFNEAFVGLLGGTRELGTRLNPHGNAAEFVDFESFLFSMRPAANPREELTRRLPASTQFIGLDSAVDGSPMFFDVDPGNGQANYVNTSNNCNQCHMLPTGSIGSIFADNNLSDVAGVAQNRHIETIQFSNFLQARDMAMLNVTSVVDWTEANATGFSKVIARPYLGTGTMHSGGRPSFQQLILNRFATVFDDNAASALEGSAQGAAFVMCLDTGTAPAAHHVIALNRINTKQVADQIESLLLSQAKSGYIDVIVYNASQSIGGQPRDETSWLYRPAKDDFIPDDGGAAVKWSSFQILPSPSTQYIFMGVLPGTGERLALDFDNDGARNHLESGLDARVPDRDGDGYPDGYEMIPLSPGPGTQGDPDVSGSISDTVKPELVKNAEFKVLMVRASHAEFTFEATEDVRWTIQANPTSGARIFSVGRGFARTHTAHVHGLEPDTKYDVKLILADRNNQVAVFDLVDAAGSPTVLQTLLNRGGALPRDEPVISSLTSNAPSTGPVTSATFAIKVTDAEHGSLPMPGLHVLAQIMRKDSNTDEWSRVPEQDIVSADAVNSGAGNALLNLDTIYGGVSYPIAPFEDTAGTMPKNLVLTETTDSSGVAMVAIQVNTPNTSAIAITILEVIDPITMTGGTTTQPIFRAVATLANPNSWFGRWVMPRTSPENRVLRVGD